MMRRTLITPLVFALSATTLAACGVDRPTGTPPPGVVQPPLNGWSGAPPTAELPPPREVLLELGYPHELPERPRTLTVAATYRPWTSGRALAQLGGDLFAVDTDNGTVAVIAADTGVLRRTIAVGPRPDQIAVGPDGAAFVTIRHGQSVVKINAGAAEVSETAIVGVEPIGIALSADGATVYVTVAGRSELVALDAQTLTEVARVPTVDRPRTVAFSDQGWLVVAGRAAHAVRIPVDLETGLPATSGGEARKLRQGNPADQMLHFGRPELVHSNRARGATVHPEHGAVLIVHQQTIAGTEMDSFAHLFGNELSPNGMPSGGGGGGYSAGGGVFSDSPHLIRPMETSVSVVGDDASYQEPAWPVKDAQSLEPITSRVAQPSDINHHPTHTLALVTGFGSDTVLVLNTAVEDPMRSPLGIVDVGMAPKAVAFSDNGKFAYVLNAHTFSISEIDLTPFFYMQATPPTSGPASAGAAAEKAQSPFASDIRMDPFDPSALHVNPLRYSHARHTAYGEDPLPEDMRLGRRTFTYTNNASISRDGQFACNSCHYEGAEDAMVWFVPGGPRQTPLLAGRLADTPPYNWLGTEHELQSNMEQTITRMGGTGLSPEQLTSLEKFMLDGLVPPPNPNIAADGLTASQARGKALFADPVVGCAGCHVGASFSDGIGHDVGTMTEIEAEVLMLQQEMGEFDPDEVPQEVLKFNTPTLRGLFASAPYLHDGSAATLLDVLERTGETMGKTSHLTAAQKLDVVAYLLTL